MNELTSIGLCGHITWMMKSGIFTMKDIQNRYSNKRKIFKYNIINMLKNYVTVFLFHGTPRDLATVMFKKHTTFI